MRLSELVVEMERLQGKMEAKCASCRPTKRSGQCLECPTYGFKECLDKLLWRAKSG